MSKGEAKASSVGEGEKSTKRLFVITPIGENNSPERRHADWVLNAAIKPVFELAGYTVYRSDTIDDPSMINDAIFNHIFEDDLCVADFTFLNPNVLYEVGVRHSQLKPVIHIAHVGTRLPFDTAQHRAIFFDLSDWHSVEALKDGLTKQLATVEAKGFEVSNPITHARGRIEVSRRGDDKDQLLLDLMGRMELFERKLSDVGNTYAHRIYSEVEWGADLARLSDELLEVFASLDPLRAVSPSEIRARLRKKFGNKFSRLTSTALTKLEDDLIQRGVPPNWVQVMSDMALIG